MRRVLLPACLAVGALLAPLQTRGQPAPPARPFPHAQRVADFLALQAQQASGAPAEDVQVRLAAGVGDAPACEQAQAFLPPGAAPWGEVVVGLRCPADTGPGWTRYLQAQVSVRVRVPATARTLPAGHRLAEGDLVWAQADLARLAADALRDPQPALGALTAQPLGAGHVLRRANLRAEPVVQPGQRVRAESTGPGFLLSAQGKALGSAVAGAPVKLQMDSGRIVSGQAQADGSVRVLP